jgi:predicted RNA-binding protein YlqC (UPF0109 family)
MEEFVAYIIKNLVSRPDAVQVTAKEGAEMLKLEIRVAPEDVGKMIGRKGNTINALRTIVRTVATRLGRQVQVELMQPERQAQEKNKQEMTDSDTDHQADEDMCDEMCEETTVICCESMTVEA